MTDKTKTASKIKKDPAKNGSSSQPNKTEIVDKVEENLKAEKKDEKKKEDVQKDKKDEMKKDEKNEKKD